MISHLRRKPIHSGAMAVILALGLAACEGDQGGDGVTGPTGRPGDSGVLDPNLPAVDKVFIGLGGRDALAAVTSFSYTATGFRFLTGEGLLPDDDSIEVTRFTTIVSADLANDAWRLEHDLDLQHFFNGIDVTFDEIIDGQLGAVEGIDLIIGQPAPNHAANSARTEAVRRQAELLNPFSVLKRVLAAESTDEPIATETGAVLVDGRPHHILEVADDIGPLSLLVNPSDGTITGLRTVGSDFAEGDVVIEVGFDDWRSVGDSGVLFPQIATLSVNGQPFHVESRKNIEFNPTLAVDTFDFPAGLDPAPAFDEDLARRGASHHHNINAFAMWGLPFFENTQDEVIVATEVGTGSGVFHLIGGAAGSGVPSGTHHTMVVDQGSSVVVIEPALYDDWGSAVVAWIAANIQDGSGNPKPISHVIVTHHHHDHMGAVRRFAVEGAKVVVGQEGARFFGNVLSAPFTVFPDTLAQSTALLTREVIPVGAEPFVIGTGDLSVAAIPIANGHASDLMVVRIDLPGTSDAVFFNSDMYNVGPPVDMAGDPVPILGFQAATAVDLDNGLQGAPNGLDAQANDIMLGGHGVATYDDPRVAGQDASFVIFSDFQAQVVASSN